MTDGTIHAGDAVALQAAADMETAYNDAAGRTPDAEVGPTLDGLTLTPGVYRNSGGSLELSGTLTLDAQGDPGAVFILQTADTSPISTTLGSTVALVNGANPCNVFWQTGFGASLGAESEFAGTILARADIFANTGANVEGRLLAGSVSLNTNVINRPDCDTPPPTTTRSTPTPGLAPQDRRPSGDLG